MTREPLWFHGWFYPAQCGLNVFSFALPQSLCFSPSSLKVRSLFYR